ncbi:hypothetical protein L596_016878 [Steinernema carpocapsae]|uniref:Uncharacterized protein n=1 Tax=Steinernema carpocapsae TaxID=34508 RepID=A0A4U5NKE3_STECR|nr:hypothetical protein L596_016878 [Steinernema carpocapsae]
MLNLIGEKEAYGLRFFKSPLNYLNALIFYLLEDFACTACSALINEKRDDADPCDLVWEMLEYLSAHRCQAKSSSTGRRPYPPPQIAAKRRGHPEETTDQRQSEDDPRNV